MKVKVLGILLGLGLITAGPGLTGCEQPKAPEHGTAKAPATTHDTHEAHEAPGHEAQETKEEHGAHEEHGEEHAEHEGHKEH